MASTLGKFVNFSGAWRILKVMADLAMSDADLLVMARGGDVEALAGLLERHRISLYSAAIGLLHRREDALDAVQETFVVALTRLSSVRDPAAVRGWLHAVLRNTCLMQLRRSARQVPLEPADASFGTIPSPEEAVDQVSTREWLWAALNALSADDRATVILRHFSRCSSYEQIAAATGVPVGTVRSRLHRSRAVLVDALTRTTKSGGLSQSELESERRDEWEDFYARLHEAPVPDTYAGIYSPDVEVTDSIGRWCGLGAWSAHEREAITLGVRARILSLAASQDLTVIEIDFVNPEWARDHCPPRSTFVHRLAGGRSERLAIHYV